MRHLHAVGDLEALRAEGARLVAAEEHDGVGDIVDGREGVVLARGLIAPRQRHHREEVVGGGALRRVAHLVHSAEHIANARAFNGARIHRVDADAVGAELQRKLLGERAERSLGHHIRRPAVVLGPREDGRDIDDARAATEVRRDGPHHVPGETKQVAGGIAHRLGVGGTGRALRLEFLARQRLLEDRLLGTRGSGVVDEDIDAAVLAHHRLDAETRLPRIGGVERQRHHIRSGRARRRQQGHAQGVEFFAVAAGEHDRRPLLEITTRDHLADAACGAGDDRDLTDEAAGAQDRRDGPGRGLLCDRFLCGRLFGGSFLGGSFLGGRAHGRAPHSWKSSSRLRKPARGKAWLTT